VWLPTGLVVSLAMAYRRLWPPRTRQNY
jgi:hypothetical protein